ncbi:MAG: ABC transporter substrate-binding protein [Chloroflexia bacterium]|nr:ABC transporter substrate-binding protein [Chloroflexia bacterium]
MAQAIHTRRSVIGGALGLGATAAAARFATAQEGSPEASSAASPAADGEWSFTDDKGVTVTLPSRPERLVIDVNAASPLWDFGVRPVAVFGWLATASGDFGPAGGRIDPEQVEIIGEGEATIDVEALVGLQPDLIITLTFSPDDPLEYWSLAADGPLEQVQQVAPIVAISGVQSSNAGVARFAELAVDLGMDLETPEVTADLERWQASEAAFGTALADKPGISAIFTAPSPDVIYIANPQVAGDLQYYRELGLTIPDVEINPDDGNYWEYASLEEIGKYQTDLLFSSYRGMPVEEFLAIPTVATLPAVTAGQVYTWNQDEVLSYRGIADSLDGVIEAITAADIVTG